MVTIGEAIAPLYAAEYAALFRTTGLHALQKKSKTGIKTPQADINLITERLKRAQADYEASQGASDTRG